MGRKKTNGEDKGDLRMKKRTVAILGVGHVGAHVANALIMQGIVDELILIDKNEQKVISEVNDLQDELLWMDHPVEIRKGDFADLARCDVLINAVGSIDRLLGGTDRGREMKYNIRAVNSFAQKIRDSGFDGILINISNPCDVITSYLADKTGRPRHTVFGTGTALDSSRLISAVSKKTGLARRSIDACMIGEHGHMQFAPSSVFSVRGISFERAGLQTEEIDWQEMEQEAINGGWVSFAGKGCTEYGIAATAARLVKAVLQNEQVLIPVSAPLDGEYGQKGIHAGVPAIISRHGIERVPELALSHDELERFTSCCQGIRDNLEKARSYGDRFFESDTELNA